QAVGVDPLQWVLTGGEDHAIVATFPPDVKLPTRRRVRRRPRRPRDPLALHAISRRGPPLSLRFH
ncbi:hypothetical protein AB0B51_32230, partial [Streptomyces griseus]